MIRKFQNGGPSVFVQYTPFTAVTQQTSVGSSGDATTSNSKDSSDEKGKLTEQNLMTMIKDIDGLPSDMNGVIQNVQRLLRASEFGGTASDLKTIYLKALQQVKTASFFKKQWDQARELVNSNKGMNEVAIDDMGRIFAYTEKGLSPVSVDEYLKNQSKYQVLSNQDLLNMRANDLKFSGNQDMLKVVQNGIGLEKVNELIKAAVDKIGSTEIKTEGYSKKEQDEITKGIEFLNQLSSQGVDLSGMSMNGVYKNKFGSKEQIQQAKKAINYVYSILPDNAKSLLKIKTGSKEGAEQMISSFIGGQTSDTKEFSADWIIDENGEKPGSKESKSSSEANADLFSDIIMGKGGTNGKLTLKDSDGRVFEMNGTNFPNLSVNSSKPVEEGTLNQLLTVNGFNSLLKGGKYAITFGNQVLNASDMDSITFMNDSQSIRTILPVTVNDKGEIVPDLEFAKNNEEIIELINSKQGNFNDPEVQSKLQEAGIIDPMTGLPDMRRFQTYLCVNGLGTSRNIKDNSFATEIKGDQLDPLIDKFERNVYRDKKDNNGSEYKFDFDRRNFLNPFDWLPGSYDKLYEGTIFIPVTENVAQGKLGAGVSVSEVKQDSLENTYQSGEARRWSNTSSTSSSMLGI